MSKNAKKRAHSAVIAWARAHRTKIPPRPIGCPCGCESRPPYLIDPACTAAWPIREDPVCGACGTLLDPDGSCYGCPGRPLLLPAQPFTGRCFGCGQPGHYRNQCPDRKRPDAG